MNLSDVDAVNKLAPHAILIATHLGSVNHALLSREDIRNHVRANNTKIW